MITMLALCMLIFSSCNRKDFSKQGLNEYEEGNYKGASEYFQAAISNDSTLVDNYVYLGMCYLALEEYDEAKKTFNLGVNLDSSEKMLDRGLGLVAFYQEKYEEAIEYFNKGLSEAGISIGKTECDMLMYRAKSQTKLGKYKDAADSYTTLLKADSEDGNLYYNRGCLWLELSKIKEAKEDFSRAIELEGASYQLYWNIYQSFVNHNKKDEANKYIKMALELPVNENEVHKYRALFLYLEKDYKGAISEFEKLKESDSQVVVSLAYCYKACGELDKANAVFEKALKENKNDVKLYNQYGVFLIENEQFNKAIKWLMKGKNVDSESDTKNIEYNLIIAYEGLQDYNTALQMLELYEASYGMTDVLEKEREFLDTRLS